jgi:hypothetical protein
MSENRGGTRWSANDANSTCPGDEALHQRLFTDQWHHGGVFYNAIYGNGDYKVSQLKDKIISPAARNLSRTRSSS